MQYLSLVRLLSDNIFTFKYLKISVHVEKVNHFI